MTEIAYEEHQRDYTLLGNSATFTFLVDDDTSDYFGYESQPLYVCKKDGLFYHYYATEDKAKRATHWAKRYAFDEFERKIDEMQAILPEIRSFYDAKHKGRLEEILTLYGGYRKILCASLLMTEVPGYIEIPDRLLDLCFMARKASEFVYKEGESLGAKLIRAIEHELNMESGTVENLTYRELLAFSKDQQVPEEVHRRKDFVLIEIDKNGDRVFYERSALNAIHIPAVIVTDVIKGVVANNGRVRGRVRIVTDAQNARLVQGGDVLVASMTDPRHLQAMARAAGFVTDEGGITCHAAIVARELKKPCIIGTKIATQVLKDGDMVEVDAERGVVRILERA